MEEKGLSQRNTVDWIVQIVALVQLHLKQRGGGRSSQQQWNVMTPNMIKILQHKISE